MTDNLSPEMQALVASAALGFDVWEVTDRAAWLARRESAVTASVAAAPIGVHPYMSPYGLYMLKSRLTREDPEESGPMRRGRLLEPVHAPVLAEDNPTWMVQRGRYYFRDPARRIGATPDLLVVDPSRAGFGVVQLKSVEPSVFRKAWRDPDTGEIVPPTWIAIQALVEAELTGASWAAVSPMMVSFGIPAPVVDIPLHAGLRATLTTAVADFWRRVEEKDAYDPDFGRDAALIANAYQGNDDEAAEWFDDARAHAILADRALLKVREADGTAAAKERRALDSELLHKLGNAKRARLADGTLITASIVKRGSYVVDATQYPRLSVKPPKGLPV